MYDYTFLRFCLTTHFFVQEIVMHNIVWQMFCVRVCPSCFNVDNTPVYNMSIVWSFYRPSVCDLHFVTNGETSPLQRNRNYKLIVCYFRFTQTRQTRPIEDKRGDQPEKCEGLGQDTGPHIRRIYPTSELTTKDYINRSPSVTIPSPSHSDSVHKRRVTTTWWRRTTVLHQGCVKRDKTQDW